MVILYLYFFTMGCTKVGRWERERGGGGGGRKGGREEGRKEKGESRHWSKP